MKSVSNVIVLVAWAILIAACGGGGGDTSPVSAAPSPPPPPPPPPPPNLAPTADAGEDQLVVPPATITLDGGGSSDSDGSIVSYSWNQILGSPIQLAQPDSQIIQFDTSVFSTAQFLVFELSVADDDGAVSTDQMSVVVKPINPSGENVTVWNDNLIIHELDSDQLVPGNLFDLEGRTLRFSPEGGGYRVESIPLQWDSVFGSAISTAEVRLANFEFPFSGDSWATLFVDTFGNITFGGDQSGFFDGIRDGGLLFRLFAGSMINTIPIISPLFRKFEPLDGVDRLVKELSDRVIITWTVSEQLDFLEASRANRFQVVLHQNGEIDFSYEEIAVRDGIVGVFPLSRGQQPLGFVISDPIDADVPPYIDIINVAVSLVGNHSLRFDFILRGDVLPEGDPRVDFVTYRVFIDLDEPFIQGADSLATEIEIEWGIGVPGVPTELTYQGQGPGVSPNVVVNGNTISLTASLEALGGLDRFAFFTDALDFDHFIQPGINAADQTNPITVDLPPTARPNVDFSSSSLTDPDREVIYEAFHYPDVPTNETLACAVIESLGDEFDFLALYTDFRMDRQETGAAGFGSLGDDVRVGGHNFGDPANYCSAGQLQSGQVTDYIGVPRFAKSGTDGGASYDNYDRYVNLLAHEIGHRWLSSKFATIAGQDIRIGDPTGHWLSGLHAPVAFPVSESVEASTMGGNYWQDNGDGTFTLLARCCEQATGYSYLDLYMMGFLAEQDVPDFFLIQNLSFVGTDGDGNEIWSGNRLNLTVGNEIAFNGPRLPVFESSQRDFNTGFVGIVQNGNLPSVMLVERMAGGRQEWLKFWSAATGGVSTMRSSPTP